MKQHNSPKKSLGQHWLHDAQTLQDIVDAANVAERDTVLEVGPGLGTLTDVLAARAEKVIAIEYDHALAEDLKNKYENSKVEVIEADILDFDFTQVAGEYKVVANIPYYLTSHLIRRMLEHNHRPTVAVLLIQKEVAQRIVAEPGSMSMLSVMSQFYAEVSLGVEVPAHLFTPPPKVDSQVVILRTREQQLFDVDEKLFFRIAKAGFGEKRKKLANSLAGGLHISKQVAMDSISKAGLGENARAQELSLAEWHSLYKTLSDTLYTQK